LTVAVIRRPESKAPSTLPRTSAPTYGEREESEKHVLAELEEKQRQEKL